MPSVPPPLRAAEREQLANLIGVWSQADDYTRDALLRCADALLAWLKDQGYAKPSLPPDGDEK